MIADDDEPPPKDQVARAIAMIERGLRLAPEDSEIQFTHAMLLLDADRAGLSGKIDTLLSLLPTFDAAARVGAAMRMGRGEHPRFDEAVDIALERPADALAALGDISDEMLVDLGKAIAERCSDRLPRLVDVLPDRIDVLAIVAMHAGEAGDAKSALALYERMLAHDIPASGRRRTQYVRAVNNACIRAHAIGDYAAACSIADRAQPYAHENPYIFHSAACAYAAAGELAKAFEQIALAVQHDYERLDSLEVDTDLGEILGWPEFKALFRDYRARREGN